MVPPSPNPQNKRLSHVAKVIKITDGMQGANLEIGR